MLTRRRDIEVNDLRNRYLVVKESTLEEVSAMILSNAEAQLASSHPSHDANVYQIKTKTGAGMRSTQGVSVNTNM